MRQPLLMYAAIVLFWIISRPAAMGQNNTSYLSINDTRITADSAAASPNTTTATIPEPAAPEILSFVVQINDEQRKLFYSNYSESYSKYDQYFSISFAPYGLITGVPIEWKISFKGTEPAQKKFLLKLLNTCSIKEVTVNGQKKNPKELLEP